MTQAITILVFAVCGALFVFGSRRLRAMLAVMSIFVANLELEVGIGLNLPVLLMILSGLLLLVGKVPIHERFRELFSSRLFIFFLWVIAIWVAGYLCLDVIENVRYGWTRGSTVKPIVQLIRLLLHAPFAFVIADGIRSRADFKWFLAWWARIALISAVFCVVQVAAYELTGQSLGTYRVHAGEFQMTFARIGGMTILRANGLAGEPKVQGIVMAMSLCMLLGTWRRGLLPLTAYQHLGVIFLVSVALFLTFSSGAIAMTALLVGLILVSGNTRSAKHLAAAAVLVLAAAALQFPDMASAFWTARLHKIVSISTDVRGRGWGMDRERPAMIYLLDNPHQAVAGVGIGMGPFYFNDLITRKAYRDKFVDPNSGVVWGLYGFGVVGWLLFLWGIQREWFGNGLVPELAPTITLLLRFSLLYFFVLTPLMWLAIAIGLACARGTQEHRLSRRATPRALHSRRKHCHAAA
jgi:hypothetical protein